MQKGEFSQTWHNITVDKGGGVAQKMTINCHSAKLSLASNNHFQNLWSYECTTTYAVFVMFSDTFRQNVTKYTLKYSQIWDININLYTLSSYTFCVFANVVFTLFRSHNNSQAIQARFIYLRYNLVCLVRCPKSFILQGLRIYLFKLWRQRY